MEPDLTPEDERGLAAQYFARVAVWETAGGSLKTFCQRATIRCLLVRPDLMEGVSLEKLGQFFGVTRADMDKLAIDFRRTFHVQGMHQKSNNTRKRCRQSQLRIRRQLTPA